MIDQLGKADETSLGIVFKRKNTKFTNAVEDVFASDLKAMRIHGTRCVVESRKLKKCRIRKAAFLINDALRMLRSFFFGIEKGVGQGALGISCQKLSHFITKKHAALDRMDRLQAVERFLIGRQMKLLVWCVLRKMKIGNRGKNIRFIGLLLDQFLCKLREMGELLLKNRCMTLGRLTKIGENDILR